MGFVTEYLGEFLWSKQRLIAESVRDHRMTVVHGCHSFGKSFLAARIAAWWLTTRPIGQAGIVTSAPSAQQVKGVLWQEIAEAHARGLLPGRLNQTEWWLDVPDPRGGTREMLAGFGRKPSHMNPTAFQGFHRRYVLVIFDEAVGIPKSLYDAGTSLASNDDSRFLAITNPDDPQSECAEMAKPGSGANVIGISAFETPNFTGEPVPEHLASLLIGHNYVNERKRRWGEANPMYVAKVLGRFPETTEGGLIPMGLIRAAQARWLERDADGQANPHYLPPSEPVELGVDVGAGGDKSVVCERRGPRAKIIRADQNPDTMATLGNVIADLRSTGAAMVKVDPIGVGRGMVDRAAELRREGKQVPIYGLNVGAGAEHPESYANTRAESFWGLRERFQDGDIAIDPADEDLAAELVALKFDRTSRGQIKLTPKDEMDHSPDRADALNLAFADSRQVRQRRVSPLSQMRFG